MAASNSLESLGWRMFWDKDCTIPLKQGDVLPIEEGKNLELYFACVPSKINADNTVSKYDVISGGGYPIIFGLAEVIKKNNPLMIGGTNIPSTSINGNVEEVVVFEDGYSIDKISEYQIGKKTLYSDDSDDEPFFETKADSKIEKVEAFFAFKEKLNMYRDIIDSSGEIVVYGDGYLVQGKNRSAISLFNSEDHLYIQKMRLDNEFAVSVRFKIEILRNFTIIEVPNVLRVNYDVTNRIFSIKIKEYFKEKWHSYNTNKVSHMFGHTLDIAICIKQEEFFLLLDGEIIFSHKKDYMLCGLCQYKNRNDLLSSCSTDCRNANLGNSIVKIGGDFLGNNMALLLSNEKVFYSSSYTKCTAPENIEFPYKISTSIGHYGWDGRYIQVELHDDSGNKKVTNMDPHSPKYMTILEHNSKVTFKMTFSSDIPQNIPDSLIPFVFLFPQQKTKVVEKIVHL